jgi:hypothetical protein
MKIKIMVKLPALRVHALLMDFTDYQISAYVQFDVLSVHYCVNPIECTATVFMYAIFPIYGVGRKVIDIARAQCLHGDCALLAPCYTVNWIAK